MKHEKLQVSDYGSFQNAEVGLAVLLGDEMIAQRKTEMFSQKSKVVLSSPSPCGDEERRGNAFLIQVKEKLTDADYKEYLGFMKALKSKTMKIDQVLQIVLFSK
ncbi:regulator of telomere elongation helicase 1 homolog [Camellia sinensis]|uniref:regulator of telomere elongation helicase 1 homolog n=1 Tax=Camellia sinensis TaxID=4442 RepID=UPI001035DCFA|nr:regulator of telomere elongation helicase 1 homolog [Camellia sinensis]